MNQDPPSIVGVIIISYGLLSLYRPFIEGLIRFRNRNAGVTTEISGTTIMLYRIGGIGCIICGILWVLGIDFMFWR